MKRFWCVFAILTGQMYGQVAGRLTGSVVDPTGAAVPNAKVSLFLPGGNAAVISTATTSDGNYTIPTVRPDQYDLIIEADGFNKARIEGLRVQPSIDTSVSPVKLEIATASTAVDVHEDAGTVQTASAEVTSNISRTQIDHLPVLDRQVTNLFITQPGVTSAKTSTTIDGLRPSYSNLLLDGVNIQDSVRTNPLDYVPNRLTIGQIADITVASSNVNPTIGGNANTVSLNTPSGTNQFHGNGYWYNRNSYFAANDWFNNQSGIDRPFLNLNQLGGSVGGPIIKDKLLFYTNYEAYRLRQTSPTQRTILTPEARQGIFRYRDASGAVQSFDLLKNNQLTIDPYVQQLLSQVPTQGNFSGLGDGLNTTGYSFNARNDNTRDNVTGKIDYYLSTRNTFSGSYIWNRDIQDRPDDGTFYTVTPPIFNDGHSHFMSAGWRWNPSPSLTNEVRGGFNRSLGTFQRRTPVPSFFVAGNLNNLPLVFDSPVNETLPESRTTNTYSLQDNGNWVRGRHSLSFGFQATLWRTQEVLYNGIVPSYTLSVFSANIPYGYNTGDIPGANSNDTFTANSLLGALGGLVSNSTQTFNVASRTSGFVPNTPQRYNLNMNNYAPYVSDTWKLRRNLTLILGLRYEYFSPVQEAKGLIVEPLVQNGDVTQALLGNPSIGFVPGRLYKRDWNNFAPNVGFAWDVFGNGTTAVRGGYAIAYVNDNNINSVYNTYAVNNGLTSSIAANDLNGRVTGSLPPITTPAFQLPTTLKDQFLLSPSSPPVQGLIDPNLRTPYTQQWSLGVEHSWKGFVASGRYVGNNTTGQFRQIDLNQINISQGTYLQDFKAARNNGFLAQSSTGHFDPTYNPSVPGSQALPFFNQLPNGGFLNSATVVNLIQTGQAGSLAQTYQSIGEFPSAGFSFFPNPYALYSSILTNAARSNYNAGQFEVTKRMSNGILIQASYVYSKTLSTAAAFRGIEAQLDNNNRSLERARATYDLAHSIKLNHYIPLPVKFQNGLLNRVLGGWAAGGFMLITSGQPVSVLSNRGTLNRSARSIGVNTADTNLTGDQLRATTGLFKNGNGVYWIDPSHIGSDGRGVAPDGQAPFQGQIFFNPGPGDVGTLQRRYLDGPWFKNYNFSLQKNTKITERQSLEFRADAYNLFNHPNFWPSYDLVNGDHDINNVNFGRITAMASSTDGNTSRVLQFGLFYRF